VSIDLIIDLDDGLPPARTEKVSKPRTPSFQTPKLPPVEVKLTRTPIAVVISYARVTCLGCGAEHTDHRGIFIENRVHGPGPVVRELQRTTLRELAGFSLPRRVDEAPREATPVCIACWQDDQKYADAVAVARTEGELFGSPEAPAPVKEVAVTLIELAEEKVHDAAPSSSDPGQ
jgi:hypothetical protein